ncbi:hypothetical protein P7H12_00545 [Paenibacillus larvae]|nr:hypothetical protein [Paenibacillus larvae]MDT2262450.1 hypothetical protein [Paenibacillus larvae]
MRRTKYSNEFKVQVVKGSSGNQKQSSRGKTLRACLNIESGKWGVISVEGISPLETRSCPKKMTT